jgi:hypothetical protein
MAEKELLTAAKLAQEWGVSEKAVKEAVDKSGVEPDATRGKCKFYAPASTSMIKKSLPKKIILIHART